MCRARIGYCPFGSTSTSSRGNRSTSFAEINGLSSERLLTLALSSSARTRDWLSVTAVIVERPKAFDSTWAVRSSCGVM